MKRIWKYSVVRQRHVTLPLPRGYDILRVGVQNNEIQVWAGVDPGADTLPVEFLVVETNEYVPDSNYRYLNTVLLDRDSLVLHVYVKDATNAASGNVASGNSAPVFNVPVPSRPASMGGNSSAVVTKSAIVQSVDYTDVPPGGLVFNYKKRSGEVRLMRLNHVQFHVNVANGRQQITGYDSDRSEMRTVYLDSIVNFPEIII